MSGFEYCKLSSIKILCLEILSSSSINSTELWGEITAKVVKTDLSIEGLIPKACSLFILK